LSVEIFIKMKEEIVQYKGTNPLIGIASSLTAVAYLLSVMTIIPMMWPTEDGFKGFFQGIFTLFLLLLFIGMPFTLVGDGLYSRPAILYATKRTVRATVMFASLMGIAFLLFLLASSKNPTFTTTVSSLCYALSAFGAILLLAQFTITLISDVHAKTKPDRKSQPLCAYLSPIVGMLSCLSLALYHHKQDMVSVEAGESRFFLFTIGAIAILWFEDHETSIAGREITPLCVTSILWIGSALLSNYAYASLASVTFALPYLVYFLPLILLGFYYYVTAPEES
jgi:hypothetical protein